MFIAKYPFTCAGCGERKQADVQAEYDEQGSIREIECPGGGESIGDTYYGTAEKKSRSIEVMPRGKTPRDKCGECFMVHSPGQVGCE